MQLFSADPTRKKKIWKKWPWKIEKTDKKVAHNRPKPFYSTVQPRPQPTAQNWFFIFWNLGTRHLFSYLWWSLMHDFGRAKGVINIAQSRKKGSAIIVATILHYIWYALVPNLVLKSLSYMVSLSYLVMPKVYWNNFRSSYWNWILSNLKFKWNIFFNFCRLLRMSTFYIKKNWSAPDMLPICNIEMV